MCGKKHECVISELHLHVCFDPFVLFSTKTAEFISPYRNDPIARSTAIFRAHERELELARLFIRADDRGRTLIAVK